MVEKKGLGVFFLFALVVFSFSSFVYAEEVNLTDEQRAIMCLNESVSIMNNLQTDNFSIVRINDTIKDARFIFDSQQILKDKGRSADYSKVISACEDISELKFLAYSSRDQIAGLEKFYKEYSEGIDTTEIDNLFLEINKEMTNERYELVPTLIEKTYSEIIVAQSKATALNVFYDATTKGFKRYVVDNWKVILIVLLVLIILFYVFKKPILRSYFNRKVAYLELRKRSLKEMITTNQDLYFNKGKISEGEFTVKNKKLAELIRDIDRQIPMYKEQLEMLVSAKSKKKITIKEKKKGRK